MRKHRGLNHTEDLIILHKCSLCSAFNNSPRVAETRSLYSRIQKCFGQYVCTLSQCYKNKTIKI
ncbi:hypothetical protein Sbal183_2481 [Shewanella baltica OS183]|nr:hypothetical protein Sbal175_1822 [Shewanella baltica BA175]EHQ15374.1 hypothetical protein Sbal183_2481 [Shewanella baltica OS183]